MSTAQPPATRNGEPHHFPPSSHPPTLLEDWSIPCPVKPDGNRDAQHVPEARHHIYDLAAKEVGGYNDLAYNVALMATELLGNAVEHGEGDHIDIAVARTHAVLYVLVHDKGTTPPDIQPASDDFDERGRGLFIVHAYATKWGIRHDQAGTTAWFQVAIPEATP